MTRHLALLSLIAGYVAIVFLTGMEFRLLTRRWRGQYGIDGFLVCAWCACYCQGLETRSAFDPRPYRDVLVVLGVLGMLVCLGLKIARELG